MPLDPAKIRERRERLKLTQTEAAARAGMPRPHWARIELGKRDDPQLSTERAPGYKNSWIFHLQSVPDRVHYPYQLDD